MERDMTDNSVVVNLKEYGKSRRPFAPSETLPLLHECRDLLIDGVIRVLGRQLEAMENSLLSMADRSPLLETRNAYYGGQSILNKRANELLKACKDVYLTAFTGLLNIRERNPNSTSTELSLLGDQDFEATLAVNKATSRLRYNCAEELVALDARLAALLNRPKLMENDNPLGPKTLCQSLFDGIASMGMAQNVQIVLLNQFDLMLTTELARIYQSVNHYLVDQGVLPDIKVGMRNRPSAGSSSSGGRQEEGAPDILGLFEQLARGTPGAASSGSMSFASHTGRQSASMPEMMGNASFVPAGLSLLEALSRLQTGSLTLPGGAAYELPSQESAPLQNILRNLQQSPVMQSASPLDAVMVDAVAILFDVVFNEDSIPDHLKAQIARLQIPVLKAAMLDRGFFSHRGHPARRMLDAIAALAVRIPTGDTGNARLQAISGVVNRVLHDFDRDVSVFESAAAELETMEQLLDTTLDQELQVDIAQLQQAERAEIAPIVVHDVINRCLGELAAPQPISHFLRTTWSNLLTANFIRDGESGAHFNSHVETMRELAWSVQPKADMDARLMLVRILPGLLKRLRDGILEVGIDATSTEKFFANLVVLHANAVRPSAQPVPLPEAVPVDGTMDEVAESSTAAREPDHMAPVESTPVVETLEHDDDFSLRARALNKGDWIEIHYEDGTFRWARLGWVSGIRNTYLFSDQDGLNSFSISLYRLADMLRNGQAVIVERKSITDSAFGKLLSTFRLKLGLA